MAYEHEGYTLHKRKVILRGGHEQIIYFFSKRKPYVGEPMDEIPEGYAVAVNKGSGLPYLRKQA